MSCAFDANKPDAGDAACHFTNTRPLNTFRGGEDNLSVARGWLKECDSDHAFCKRQMNDRVALPTRLIEIADGDSAQLTETEGRWGRYIALSYCWGPDPEENNKTTSTNLASRLEPGGLQRCDFPDAIKDAIAISEQLGINHIWVDSFCIIQDEPDDVKAELGKMSQYYRNSYLTIAASTPRCTSGFIGETGRCEKHSDFELPRDLVPLDIFSFYRHIDHGANGKVYVREENPYFLSEESINKRAWTLQEFILAPRVLLFGSRVMWFCQHATHSDGGVEDWSLDESDLEGTRRQFQIELNKLDRQGEDDSPKSRAISPTDGNHRSLYDLWHRIVQAYSRRAITHSHDKLPAISAIATEFGRLSGDDYLAGLWRHNLLRDLLWTTTDPETDMSPKWRAPTWSWVSVDNAVLYDQLPPKDATVLAEITKAETVPLASVVPFGEIDYACLEITAPCLSLVLSEDSKRAELSEPWLRSFQAKRPVNKRTMLLEALQRSHLSSKGGQVDGEEAFQLPDEVKIAIFYTKPDELSDADDRAKRADTKTFRLFTWGLLLKPLTGGSVEQRYERILAFSKVPLTFDDERSLSAWKETIRIE
jgi:hypothetical protein